MSTNVNNPYNVAGKPIQGGLPADLEFIRFNFANNQWEFVTVAAGGEINLGANVGAGVGLVFRDKTGVTLNFKTLLQGANITLTNNADDITIEGPAPGETNLTANVGGGAGLVFRDKIGVTFNLKSLLAGSNITLTNNADDITIASTAAAVTPRFMIHNTVRNTNNSTTRFGAVYDDTVGGSETGVDQTINFAYEVNRMTANVPENAKTSDQTVGFRDDGADAGTVVITGSATGEFDSGALTIAVASGSAVNFRFVWTVGGNVNYNPLMVQCQPT